MHSVRQFPLGVLFTSGTLISYYDDELTSDF